MPISDEERKRRSERMRAMHAAKKAEKGPQQVEETKINTQQPETSQGDLARQVEELKKNLEFMQQMMTQNQQPAQQVHVGSRGMVGTHEKFSTKPKDYPDPRERLSKEPRLQRFAFPINYELTWDIKSVRYQTQDGVWMQEPRFEIELLRIAMDNDTGEPTDGRWILRRLQLHEDPAAAVAVAREKGLEVDENNEKAFLDEMRYLRIRDWLFDAFFQPKADNQRSNMREMAIDGKLVPYFEVNSENNASIPFNQLDKKL